MSKCRHCNDSKVVPLFTGVSTCPWCEDKQPQAQAPERTGGMVAAFLRVTFTVAGGRGQRSAMVLGDGSRVSVQASEGHYCEPRVTGLKSYTRVEVGFPTHADGTPWSLETVCPELAPFEDYPGSHVYGFVPVEVLEAIIARHGGIG